MRNGIYWCFDTTREEVSLQEDCKECEESLEIRVQILGELYLFTQGRGIGEATSVIRRHVQLEARVAEPSAWKRCTGTPERV